MVNINFLIHQMDLKAMARSHEKMRKKKKKKQRKKMFARYIILIDQMFQIQNH